jgi:outer membrane protein TolC
MRIIKPLALIFAVSAWPEAGLYATSNPEVPPPPVVLEQLIQTARRQNPEMLEAEAEWQAARKRIWADSALPDPVAGFDLMGGMVETRVGPQENRFVVSQDIPFPLKLWEKGKMAQEQARAARGHYLAVTRDIENRLTKLFYELYFIDASIRVIEDVKDLWKTFEGVAQARYSSVSGSQRDVAKAETEVAMSFEKLYTLGQRREAVAAMINALLDRDPMTSVGAASQPEIPVLKRSLIELVNLAVIHRQEIKEAEAVAAKSKHAVRLARLSYIPDLNVGFEYTSVGGGTSGDSMDGQDSWMFPLRFTVPLWQNRIVPEIQEAQKMRDAKRAGLLRVKNTAFFEVKEAYYRYDAASKIARLYETGVIPQAEMALRSDRAGFESGKSDFLNLLDSGRVFLNAKLSQIQFRTEALNGYADLVRATGLDLDGVSGQEAQS